ncbi:Vegetative incompatibility protein HET-E-1 [Trametes pubescens]|uniref:Vegetative incompatibility protein HET-E-1 n=1 Tax=Trametes pubescens TaxID=154538 RepID=A0A1M2VEL8_TRAPU|nr:Vegetative incompatibility protein HET-E-1 [Trametes pubescens]
MWLLKVEDATLENFQEGHAPPYAILSHVWQGAEQSFQEVWAIGAGVVGAPALSDKIRNFCAYAKSRGYNWVWIDTCCIDKSSSAELSEALNSMFAYYAKAQICFAYLYDINGSEDPRATPSSFRNSTWFKRGWTLQELIAPHSVIFLSPEWQQVGTNHALADVLQEITGIDQQILTHAIPLTAISVARRMSWASGRVTTRVEDSAYSLMGIFNVYMPTVYGEGPRAFKRLQEEILKQLSDQSIFAWGPKLEENHDDTARKTYERPLSFATYQTRLASEENHGLQGLLAQSPKDFAHSAQIYPIPFSELSEALGVPVPVPVYHPTSGGLRIRMPTIADPMPAPVVPSTSVSILPAILACKDQSGNLVILYLRRDSDSPDRFSVGFPTNGRYIRTALWYWQVRRQRGVQIVDFYVTHRHPLVSALPDVPRPHSSQSNSSGSDDTDPDLSDDVAVFFILPVWVLAGLSRNSGFVPWNADGRAPSDGLSITVPMPRRMPTGIGSATAGLLRSEFFRNAYWTDTGGRSVPTVTFLRISFWLGCRCPRTVDTVALEDIWVDFHIGSEEMLRQWHGPTRRSLRESSDEGECSRHHLSRDAFVMRFQKGRYVFHCRIMPWCPALSSRQDVDAAARWEYLMDLRIRQDDQELFNGPSPGIQSVEYNPHQQLAHHTPATHPFQFLPGVSSNHAHELTPLIFHPSHQFGLGNNLHHPAIQALPSHPIHLPVPFRMASASQRWASTSQHWATPSQPEHHSPVAIPPGRPLLPSRPLPPPLPPRPPTTFGAPPVPPRHPTVLEPPPIPPRPYTGMLYQTPHQDLQPPWVTQHYRTPSPDVFVPPRYEPSYDQPTYGRETVTPSRFSSSIVQDSAQLASRAEIRSQRFPPMFVPFLAEEQHGDPPERLTVRVPGVHFAEPLVVPRPDSWVDDDASPLTPEEEWADALEEPWHDPQQELWTADQVSLAHSQEHQTHSSARAGRRRTSF